MSIKVYDGKNKVHPGGFKGVIVTRTIGTKSNVRTEHFPLNEMTLARAKRVANELDQKWKEEAEQFKRKRRINGPKRVPTRNTITNINGLSLALIVSERKSGIYLYPIILCQRAEKGYPTQSKAVGIHKHASFKKAWFEACRYYRDFYELSPKEYTKIRKSCPSDKDVLTFFKERAKEKCVIAPISQLKELLGVNQ